LQELVGIGAIARRQRYADAGADVDGMAVDLERCADGLDDAHGKRFRLARIAHAGLDDRELVAAEPRHQVAVAHAAEQPLAHLLEKNIADRVPQRVVDSLEVIEIEAQYGEALPAHQAL